MKKSLTYRSSARAAVILFFIMVALPLIWVAGALSVDYARVRMAESEAQQIVNAAANAAAPFAAQTGSALEVDGFNDSGVAAAEARQAARNLVKLSCENDSSISNSGSANCETLANGVDVDIDADNAVTVSVDYRIDGLVFLGILDNFLSLGENASDGYTATVSATSRACTVAEADSSSEDVSACYRPAR